MVTWEGSASCEGAASFVATGAPDQCYRELSEAGALGLTFAACTADMTRACAWLANYADPAVTLEQSTCTTAFGVEADGSVNSLQGSPDNNGVNALTTSQASYDLDTCYDTTAGNGGAARSIKFFCGTIPSEFESLSVVTERDLSPTPPPADPTVDLLFDPIIAENCTTVTNGEVSPTYLVYWLCNTERCGACSGTPAFIATGGDNNCFQSGFFEQGLLTMTYLSCNAEKTLGCTYSADYTNILPAFPQTFECTTASNTAQGGALPPGQTVPSINRNQFAINTTTVSSIPAPFEPQTCYAPANPTVGKRSYQIFCNFDDIPVEWQGLPIETVLTPSDELAYRTGKK